MEAVLDISLCSGIIARRPDGERLALPSRKSGLLLAFLAMQPGGRATREQVIARLWSDRGEAQARASMRQELLALRKRLAGLMPSPLRIEGEELALDLEATQVDAVTFERLCRTGSVDDLKRAVALCQGEFLSGFLVRDPGGEEWLRAERRRLRDLLVGALQKLLAHHLGAGDVPEATTIAKRLIETDPLREDGHRALIALHAAAGERALALGHYEDCRALFRRELDVDLDPATVRLAQRLRETGVDAEPLLRDVAAGLAVQVGRDGNALPAIPSGAPAIAVLPFSTPGETGHEFCGDGLVDGITGALSRVRPFFVISRASVEQYRNRPLDLARIGAELGVRYVVTGSMQSAGERIRLRVQLVETSSSGVIWSDHHDTALEDVFDVQDRITERIVGAIAPSVRMAEIERARRKRPENLAAYDYVMRALPQIWAMSREANDEALRMSLEAIRLDENYALAHAYASWCHFWGFANGWSDRPEHARAEAFRLIHRGLQLDSNDPNVLSIAALNATAIAHDLDAAAAYVEKALALDPNFTWGWNRSGYIEVYRDNIDTALAHFDRAALLSPFDPLTFNRLVGTGLAHYAAGRYEEAVALTEQASRERPGLPWAYRVLAAAQVELGNFDAARAAVATLVDGVPSLTVERIMSSMPFRRGDIRDRFASALSVAGVPEGKAAA